MNEDRIKGAAEKVGGKVEAAVGSGIGDAKTEAEGRLTQAKGVANDLVGQAKDAVGKAGDTMQSAADQARDFTNDAMESGGRLLDEGRRRYPEVERRYREGSDVVRGQVQDSPLAAILVAGAVGYVLAWMIHGRG